MLSKIQLHERPMVILLLVIRYELTLYIFQIEIMEIFPLNVYIEVKIIDVLLDLVVCVISMNNLNSKTLNFGVFGIACVFSSAGCH